MAEEGFQLRAFDSKDCAEDDELQPADSPTSALASLHLRDEAVVVNERTNHMVDNPEPHSVFTGMMSLPLNQSQQQTDISMATRPEPSPAVQGKIKGAMLSIFKYQYSYHCDDNSNCDDAFEQL